MNAEQFEALVRLRPNLAKFFHFVGAGGHIKRGYYRRIPRIYYDRGKRPASQLRSQVAFGEAAFSSYGVKGKGSVAAKVQKEMKGKRFRLPAWQRAMQDLSEAMKEVGVVIEAKAKEI